MVCFMCYVMIMFICIISLFSSSAVLTDRAEAVTGLKDIVSLLSFSLLSSLLLLLVVVVVVV